MKKNQKTNASKYYSISKSKFPLAMRIGLFFLFITALQLHASVGYAQKTKISVHANGITVASILDKIEQSSEFVFLYSNKTINANRIVSITANNKDVSNILDQIFGGTDVHYAIVDRQIILSSENLNMVQQGRIVKGRILDDKGDPLIGANIMVEGTKQGVISDLNGEFSINVPADKSMLTISYIGMKTIGVSVSNKTFVEVKLLTDAAMIDEVVVTAMGIERNAKSLTYTAQSVLGSELTRAKDVNLINTLQGKSAGLIITPNATGAGGSSKILLRGNKSINGNNNPLIVVDGVPMANNTNDGNNVVYGGGNDGGDALSTMNSDDIASISVLKGAAASALYGAVAANGVIMVTTKRGREGKIRVDVSSNMTMEAVYNKPELQANYGAKLNPSGIPQNQSWGDKMKDKATDNVSDYYRTGYNLNNSVALSGGSEKSQTYFSYGNTTAEGVTPTNSFMRHNITGRQNFQLFDNKLSVDFAVNYIFQRSKNKPTGGMLNNPLTGLYLFPRNGDFGLYKNTYEEFDPLRGVPTQNWVEMEEHNQNPYWLLNRNKANEERHRVTLSGNVKYQILEYLSIQGRMSYERDNMNFRREKYATSWRNFMGSYSQSNGFYEQLYGDIMLNFNKKISDFTITAAAGTSFTDTKNTSMGINGDGGTEAFYWKNITGTDGKSYQIPAGGNAYFPNNFNQNNYYRPGFSEGYSRTRLNSVFGTLQVGYNEMAYIDVTARNDWSSTLAYTKNKSMSFFYPSVGANVLLNEIFHMNANKVNLFKIRASYSIVGNAIPAYIAFQRPSVSGTSVSRPETMPFVDLKPEKTYSVEGGFDLLLFDSRFNMDFTYYKTNTKNQYFTVEAAWASGYRSRHINAGNVQNTGFEVTAGYRFDFGKDWSWKTELNLSYNENEIKELCEGIEKFQLQDGGGILMLLEKGGSYGDIYTRTILRDEKGVIKLDDTGSPLKDANRDVYAGNLNAKTHLGWSNTVRYKDFTLYLLVDGKVGGKVVSTTEALLDGYGVSKRSGEARDNGGIPRGDGTMIDPDKYYHSVGATAYNSGYAGAEYIYDATNFRLRELSLGYTFRNVFGPSRDITASVVGRNLFFFYKDSPCDPDISGSTGNGWQGLDVFSMPTTRSFGLNLKLTF